MFAILGLQAWGFLSHRDSMDLSMKVMSITFIPMVLFVVGWVVAMAIPPRS